MRGSTKRSFFRGLFVLAAVVAGVVAVASAQATQDPLDTTFGSAGRVTTSLSSGVDEASAVAVQADGKIVVAGAAHNNSQFGIARYNADGSLDTSFGTGGTVAATYGLGGSYAQALALQPDGKIVAAGTSFGISRGQDFTLVRYNSNGALDTSFGTNGVVTTDILGHNDFAMALDLQPDGRIVAAGKANTGSAWNLALVRYNANGSLDTSFGTNGIVTTSFGSGDTVANALARQADGKLVVAGYAGTSPNFAFALARYAADGSLDTGFGSGGEVTTTFGPDSTFDVANAVLLQPDGKIVAVGDTDANNGLVRYDSNGALDTSFGQNGITSGSAGKASAAALQPNGKIVAAGEDQSDDGSHQEFAISRYDSDGSPDESFGLPDSNGEVRTSFAASDDAAAAVALQPDGRIVAAGVTTVTPGFDYNFALARYLGSTLTVRKAGNGTGTVTSAPAGIHCGPSCSAPFAAGSVTLTAKPSSRSGFSGWSGDCSGKTKTCTLTLSTDRSAVANFTALCIVPRVTGKKLNDAKRAIKRAHCAVGKVASAFSPRVKKGRVISEKPRAGKKLSARSKVKVTVSKGRG